MFCAQRTVNFNVEGAVRHKTFKNFSSRNRQKLKLKDSEGPLNFLYVTTIKIEIYQRLVKILECMRKTKKKKTLEELKFFHFVRKNVYAQK